jgi:PHD/YefM family antitoxin component YafN of YafNO toxin-antitoxin module
MAFTLGDRMITFTASQAAKRFGEIRDRAMAGPVGIERHGKVNLVVLSADEYARLKALDQRRALAAAEIPDDTAAQLAETEMDARHAHLDRLMNEE